MFFKSKGIETIAIPDVQVGGRSVRGLLVRQAHLILALLSDEKTATYMRLVEDDGQGLLPFTSNVRS